MAHLVDGNGRRGGRGVLHCDTTLWGTIEMGRLDSVSDSLLAIGDGRDVAISGDGMRKWTAGIEQKIEKGSVDWRVSFVNYTSYACCHRLPCDKKAQFHSLQQNQTLTYSSFVSRNVRLLSLNFVFK
jgi:hypothetical protein